MTYEYNPGEVPVPARSCVRCAQALEVETDAGARLAGWFKVSALDPTIWVFQSRSAAPSAVAERLRCPACERRYALAP